MLGLHSTKNKEGEGEPLYDNDVTSVVTTISWPRRWCESAGIAKLEGVQSSLALGLYGLWRAAGPLPDSECLNASDSLKVHALTRGQNQLNEKFVQKTRWIDEQVFQELFSVSQALCGPASTKMLYCINLIHNGFLAAVLSVLLWR